MDSIVVIDFGSQYAQLIVRRVREAHVYCELFPWNAPPENIFAIKPKGFILSGGPASVYDPLAPMIPLFILDSHLPILGICYGMQALTHALGGMVAASAKREYGLAEIKTVQLNALLSGGVHSVWMSHGDRIERPANGFVTLASSSNSPHAVIGDIDRHYFGVQFHPEVRHTQGGAEILQRFVIGICGAKPEWTPESIISEEVSRIREQVGGERVISAVSGGVDSSVATTMVHRAVGEQLVAVFVDNGLLRMHEAAQVVEVFQKTIRAKLVTVDAVGDFLNGLKGVTDPEQKRRIIGEKFIRVFEAQAQQLGSPHYLVQGTIYPDVVESSAPDRSQAAHIKSHHNVGGLPKSIQFDLVEPLRYLFKDEVRLVGEALGLPHSLVWRQPFPGPGLAVRCLGEVTKARLERLRQADAIFTGELSSAGLLTINEQEGTAQAFAVLLPVQSVGVMGDNRTYQETIALRAVNTDDFMTADWARLPYELLAHVANRIVNEVEGVNRVVYDITSKPPATIEWE
jgi:GMP synthase (glutamine-hydrolysing)